MMSRWVPRSSFLCALIGIATTILVLPIASLASDRSNDVPRNGDAIDLVVTYVLQKDDPHYKSRRAYAGVERDGERPPLDGVRLGLKDMRVPVRSLGLSPTLNIVEFDTPTGLETTLGTSGSKIVILDLPKENMLAVVDRLKEHDAVFFNARHADDDLRGDQCRARLLHTLASHSMLTDALAQLLRSRNWQSIVMLEGPTPADTAQANAFEASAQKFGLEIVSRSEFVLSNDPRVRDQTNITLLSGAGGAAHDIVFVADSVGEFARYIPFSTYLPRPVIGSEGLMSASWHWSWERHGAPQLNQRFDRLASRKLSSTEWAGWAAMKSVTAALVSTRTADSAELLAALSSPELAVDLYKGAPGSFRDWNGQLRQPLLLHTGNAVIERAPMEGYLHEFNTLDTLGQDRGESNCVR